jgi:hypothetical protein
MKKSPSSLIVFAWLGLGMLSVVWAGASQPAACLSANSNDWPPAARPYFLVIADTSGSMTACTTPPTAYPTECDQFAPGYSPNSCGLVPSRANDLKCALEQMTTAFSGQVRFGLSTFAAFLDTCPAGACVSDCGTPTGSDCNFDIYSCAFNLVPGAADSCGPGSGAAREGSILRVPIAKDHVGAANQQPANPQDLLSWVDDQCDGGSELFAGGSTPLNGALRDALRYFQTGLTNPQTGEFHPTPLDVADQACRSVNVILITDGDETCDSQSDAVAAADALFSTGATIGSNNFSIKTYVVNFAGGNQVNTDAIAAAGGTNASLFANDEVSLAQGLSSIVSGTHLASFGTNPTGSEICDNRDNNCNSCIDEGFLHFANIGQSCCAWTNTTERQQCLDDHSASIAALPPAGDLSLLPCTNADQQADPDLWLCRNPAETCDALDNNGLFGIDENIQRCGDPLHCPETESCNGLDDDCDGQIDEDNVCGACVPSPEVCDGCDNDCDGLIDNGSFASVSCGLAAPAQCGETRFCAAPQVAPSPGACMASAGYGSCSIIPQAEVCDGIDNNCNGAIDDNLPALDCVFPGTPGSLVYGGDSQCRKGQQFCGQPCLGFVGPSADVSDGIDNDCDGIIDNIPTSLLEDVFSDGFE